MKFLSHSQQSDQYIDSFIKFVQNNKHVSIRHKIEKCDYEITVIARDRLVDERLEPASEYAQTIRTISTAWQSIFTYADKPNVQQHYWEVIRMIGENPRSRYQQLWRFRGSESKKHFFLLLSAKEEYGLPLHEVVFLSGLWQIESGCLPIHAAGIVDRGRLFLFSGESGAGKSTVAKLSQSIGKNVLDDDQVLVYPIGNGEYTVDAWGRSINTGGVPLRATFFLTQASENFLLPINPLRTTQLLLARYSEITNNMLSEYILRYVFCLSAAISRQVPAYELHFRKSPDFWKLIDEQFPD